MAAGNPQRTDEEIVHAVLDGDREAYRVLVRRYQDVLYRHAERMVGRPDAAEDMVQNALVKGFRNLQDCRNPERVGGWLFRITSNLCKDYLKDRRRDGVSLEDAPPLVSEQDNPDRAAGRAELRGRLEWALDQLTPEKKEAFLLKHLEEHSYEEMAKMVGTSVSALKMRVLRAREDLRELLEDFEEFR